MYQDACGALVHDGIELPFLGGGGVEAIIVKGEESCVIIAELGFGPGEDHFYLFVCVEIVIVVGDGILDEAAAFFEFLAVVGVFGGEDAVFEFFWFYQGIVNAYLGRGGQAET